MARYLIVQLLDLIESIGKHVVDFFSHLPVGAIGANGAAAPIHDIVDAVPYFPYPIWMAGSVVVGIFAVVAGLICFFFFRKKRLPKLTTREIALAGLAKLAQEPLSSYEFAVRISEILRTYIDKHFGISATKTTSMEFLNAIQDCTMFSDEERQALSQFLQTADLLKYARAEAEANELKQLFNAAERLVCGAMGGEGTER